MSDNKEIKRKKKVHLNWFQPDTGSGYWSIKKAFNFLPIKANFTTQELTDFLERNPDIEVVLRYF